ncbi:HET-C domain-containing protein HetC [Blastomyces dermatitidis ER-3]|uniref:HET-C domain-containing protein HetC n=1 Tax=Ajellomyces dermatitidis (strain ER-3 / ATCC MYA-2586) TaxID=559297 RepID=A0ABP2F669_AJEDR|nr:HET-C domain-containing protein HetC [Blastomyces dermatitidis ER-3]EEQ91030.2 HET-C domain-containing protein HetC [Blastomyces dermatitidis ER-3]
MGLGTRSIIFILAILLVLLPSQVHAFGAGNIASISVVEGKNWRHGDIQDIVKTLAFIKGHKWTGIMMKRLYFGNWLRDYSQAIDVGTVSKIQADSIRVLVWILSFMAFGYATAEFEVTAERLGVYRPEEHIDNPKGYSDDKDARQYDPRLRGPIRPIELEIDPETGMKNYIANERGDWATSAGYVRYSIARSIHFGRLYLGGGRHEKGREEHLSEALRCLGQALHTLEDFSAHSNYCELVLREMNYHNVFPHVGVATQMNIQGKYIFPIVTGTFGMTDFFHSLLGGASDNLAQSEINEMDNTLGSAQTGSGSSGALSALTSLLSKVPGMKGLIEEAEALKRKSEAQAQANQHRGLDDYAASRSHFDPHGNQGLNQHSAYNQPRASTPADINPQETISQIYPILEFRDRVAKRLSAAFEKIPGLASLMEKISETLSIFIFSLLAPFIRPVIKIASSKLQLGADELKASEAQAQFEPWTNPACTDPTHSFLSKDHFSNILNDPAGRVASAVVKFVVPRVIYAFQHVDVPVDQVLDDCVSVLHHPALRRSDNEAHQEMFAEVERWAREKARKGIDLNDILSADGVKAGKNHVGGDPHAHTHGNSNTHAHVPPPSQHQSYGYAPSHSHNHSQGGQQHGYWGHNQPQHQSHDQAGGQSPSGFPSIPNLPNLSSIPGLSHFVGGSSGSTKPPSSSSSLPWNQLSNLPIPGMSNLNKLSKLSGFLGGGGGGLTRELPEDQGHSQTRALPAEEIGSGSRGQSQPYPPYQEQPGAYQQQQQQQGLYDDPGYTLPPPSGYESYRQHVNTSEYQPPTQGAHTYDYYQAPPGGYDGSRRY